MRDRIFIEESHRDFLKELDEIFKGPSRLERIDVFLVAMAIGIDTRSALMGRKEGLVRLQSLKPIQTNLIYVSAWHHLKDVEKLFDEELVYSIAEELANSGFILLNSMLKSYDGNLFKQIMYNRLNHIK